MFVRVKKDKKTGRSSVHIVESVRNGSSVKQKVIKYIGSAFEDDKLKELKSLANSVKERMSEAMTPSLFDSNADLDLSETSDSNGLCARSVINKTQDDDITVNIKNLVEERRIVTGIHDIYGKLFYYLKMDKIFKNPKRILSSVETFKNIVLSRIACPVSKLSSVDMLDRNYGIKLNVNSVYKMMDKLDDTAIEKLKDLSYKNTLSLFEEKIDVIFFDVTTVYFECFFEDELRKNGYSKDLKFNQPQILLALMVTKEGLPIGYEAYSGDTYEGHTLIPSLIKLKENYKIDKVVFVADSGMFSKNNLAELEDKGFDYIVGARIKNLPSSLKNSILDKSNYKEIKEGLSVANFIHNGKRLIVTYSASRAKKDRSDRMEGIAKLRQKLVKSSSTKSYMSNMGYKKYLNVSEGIVSLNEKKIKEEEVWDGLKGIITNSLLSDDEVLTQYKNLYQVEESFRITKHDLKIRPVFHYKPERVKAHIAICYAAYTLVRNLEHIVKVRYKKLSIEQIRKYLLDVQTSVVLDKSKKLRFTIPSSMSPEAKRIYALMEVDSLRTPKIVESFKKFKL